jgi:hypothetical protein
MALHLHRACSCGHGKDAHEHYRRGSDCSACGCTRYHGGFVLTLRVRVAPPAPEPTTVVVPDEVTVVEGPYLRPTHTAGVGGRPLPVTSEPRRVALPRQPDVPAQVAAPPERHEVRSPS